MIHDGVNEQLLLPHFITLAFRKFALPSTAALFSSQQNFIKPSENHGCTFQFLLNEHEWSPEFRSVFIQMLVYAEALPVLTTMKCSSRVGEASTRAPLLKRVKSKAILIRSASFLMSSVFFLVLSPLHMSFFSATFLWLLHFYIFYWRFGPLSHLTAQNSTVFSFLLCLIVMYLLGYKYIYILFICGSFGCFPLLHCFLAA